MFAGKKSAQIREILISESAWEEMTCLFAPSLTFRLPSNFAMKGINLVKIKLDFTDTYQVKFSRVRGDEVKDISRFDNIYCDQLARLFTQETGLHTVL